MTVLVTTHYLDEAEYCHRLALIHAGRLAALGSAAELKGIFAERPIIELRTPQPVAVMAALEGVEGVEKSSLFGTAVHAVLARPDVAADSVVRALERAGLKIDGTDRVQPSLEDVFLDVVEKAGRA